MSYCEFLDEVSHIILKNAYPSFRLPYVPRDREELLHVENFALAMKLTKIVDVVFVHIDDTSLERINCNFLCVRSLSRAAFHLSGTRCLCPQEVLQRLKLSETSFKIFNS